MRWRTWKYLALSVVASVIACGGLLAFATAARAATLSVPSNQFPTIQSAVDGAADGDVIEVQPGTYRERLRIIRNGVTLTIRAVGGASQTTIDANRGGSALVVGAGDIRIEGFRITGGTGHRFSAGADPVGGGVVLIQGPNVSTRATFQACTIAGNSVVGENAVGGGVFLGQGTQATFRNCAIRGNRAGRHGGGVILATGSSAEFIGGSISENLAGRDAQLGGGGGLFVGEGTVDLRGTSITGNVSRLAGGGVGVDNAFRHPERASTFQSCAISGNTVQPGPGNVAHGGAMHAEDNSIVRLVGCRISGNQARVGGGISSFRARVIADGSIVDANTAIGEGLGDGLGGGIASFGSGTGAGEPCARLTLSDTAVHANTATRRGGGIYAMGQGNCAPGGITALTLDRSLISSNRVTGVTGRAPEGPGTPVGGGIRAQGAALSVSDSQVIGNRAEMPRGFGGGIVLVGGPSRGTITGTTIASNHATERAGGLFLDLGTRITLERSQVHANSAPRPSLDPNLPRSGGVFIGSNGARGSIRDNDIADNEGFQIVENSPAQTAVDYIGNRIASQADDDPSGVYASFAPRRTASTVGEFEDLVRPRAQSNVQQAPRFVAFAATPARFSPTTPAFLAWSVGRAASARITDVPQPSVPSGVAGVRGDCPKTYALSGERTDRSAYGPVAVTIACAPGGGPPDPPPGPTPPNGDQPISNQFSFGKVNLNRKRGIARLIVRVPGPGRVILRRTKQVRRAVERVEAAARATRQAQATRRVVLRVRPRGKAQRRVSNRRCKRSGKKRLRVRVRARVTYRPTGGTPRTKQRRVRLVKRC